ncbi:hypothetical protein GJ496_004771 [Pomphorhynchus laevis]|nr:hypothetical protein GJ496_004771 [Pomphorhynchus laevis]
MSLSSRKLQKIKQNEIASSPFAKFDARGNLSCIVCKIRIKNTLHWNSHLHSKEHKIAANRFKEVITTQSVIKESCDTSTTNKRQASDTTVNQVHHKSDPTGQIATVSSLPEGFFDNPVVDAKIRKVEYKNKIDEEYEIFQKSIAQDVLMAEMVEEKEDTIREKDRLINEADDLIQRWSRIEKLYNTVEKMLHPRQKQSPRQLPDRKEQIGQDGTDCCRTEHGSKQDVGNGSRCSRNSQLNSSDGGGNDDDTGCFSSYQSVMNEKRDYKNDGDNYGGNKEDPAINDDFENLITLIDWRNKGY